MRKGRIILAGTTAVSLLPGAATGVMWAHQADPLPASETGTVPVDVVQRIVELMEQGRIASLSTVGQGWFEVRGAPPLDPPRRLDGHSSTVYPAWLLGRLAEAGHGDR